MGEDINELLDEAASYYDGVREHIKNKEELNLKEMEEQLHEFNKFYRKHAFDDDQTICKNYSQIISGLKEKIKEAKRGKSKQHQAHSGLDAGNRCDVRQKGVGS